MKEQYHSYPGFADFPVVNVSYEGVQLYCQWLTEKVNNDNPSKYVVEFRLPDRKEWIRAARGETKQPYAWESPYLTNENGYFLSNFKKLGVEQIHYNPEKNDYEVIKEYNGPDGTIATKVGSFQPNPFGVFDMCGNVAEMIEEEGIAVGGSFESPGYDVRVESIEIYQDASPLVGFRPIMIVKNK